MTKAVLVTGAAKRVGREIALHLAKHGFDISLHFHTSEVEAVATAAEIRALGRSVSLHSYDLSDVSCLDRLIGDAQKAHPSLSALVNSASIFVREPFASMTAEGYAQHVAINLTAPVFLMQAFARLVRRGSIVNIIDTYVKADKTSFYAYLLSKKALHDATRMAAAELAPDIRVNAVCPGLMLTAPGFDAATLKRHAAAMPLQELAAPSHVADAVHWLLEKSYLTAQTLFVDGGEQLR